MASNRKVPSLSPCYTVQIFLRIDYFSPNELTLPKCVDSSNREISQPPELPDLWYDVIACANFFELLAKTSSVLRSGVIALANLFKLLVSDGVVVR